MPVSRAALLGVHTWAIDYCYHQRQPQPTNYYNWFVFDGSLWSLNQSLIKLVVFILLQFIVCDGPWSHHWSVFDGIWSNTIFVSDGNQISNVYLMVTRSSWLNCALRDDEAVYWVSIGHYEAVAVGNWWYWVSRGHLCFYKGVQSSNILSFCVKKIISQSWIVKNLFFSIQTLFSLGSAWKILLFIRHHLFFVLVTFYFVQVFLVDPSISVLFCKDSTRKAFYFLFLFFLCQSWDYQ